MKSKNYEFLEKYFKDLSSDIKPKNNIASVVKLFIIPLFSITVSIVVAIFIYKKNLDLITFFTILIVLFLGFACAYYLIGRASLINNFFSVDYDENSNAITEYEFNQIINILFDADKILSKNLCDNKSSFGTKDIVCINEALHYLYLSALKYSETYQEYNNNSDTSPVINKERYKAVLNYLIEIKDKYNAKLENENEENLNNIHLNINYIERINTLLKNIKFK